MSTEVPTPQKRRVTPLGVIALTVVLLGAAVAAMYLTGGSLADTSGRVESIDLVPNADGYPSRIATVRLANGKTAKARLAKGEEAKPGQIVRLHVAREAAQGIWFDASVEAEPAK